MTIPLFEKQMTTEVLIDGANLYASLKALNVDIDYKKLLLFFNLNTDLIRVSYYTAMLTTDEHNPLKPLIDWMAYNGFNVVTKPAKTFTNAEGKSWIKGNMDIEMAVDALKAAKYVRQVILFTGDGDFIPVVRELQAHRVKVIVASTVETKPPMCADELRKQADAFIELKNFKDILK